jgi:hypothetical protein
MPGLLRRKVCDNPSNPQLARFNDGGTDRDGRFYAGTFWGPGDYNGALLMRIDNDLTPKVIQCDIHGANGLAFSADKRGCIPLIRQTPLSTARRWMSRVSPANAKSFGGFSLAKGSLTGRRWMWKAATGAQCLMAGVLPVFTAGEQLEEYRCRCVARQWSALAVRI